MTDEQNPAGDPQEPERRDPDLAPKAKETTEPAASAVAAPKPPLWFLFVTSVVTLGADLGSKAWAKVTLGEPKVYPPKKIIIIEDPFSFIYAKNPGGAWGLLQN